MRTIEDIMYEYDHYVNIEGLDEYRGETTMCIAKDYANEVLTEYVNRLWTSEKMDIGIIAKQLKLEI